MLWLLLLLHVLIVTYIIHIFLLSPTAMRICSTLTIHADAARLFVNGDAPVFVSYDDSPLAGACLYHHAGTFHSPFPLYMLLFPLFHTVISSCVWNNISICTNIVLKTIFLMVRSICYLYSIMPLARLWPLETGIVKLNPPCFVCGIWACFLWLPNSAGH